MYKYLLKKDLVGHKKFVKAENRVLIIGCTSKPWEASKRDLKSFFNKYLYISYPDYATCKELWEHFLHKEGDVLNPKFNVSTLAQISKGFTAGSIEQSVRKVLTEQRKNNLKWRPLNINEFISPLSRTDCLDSESYKKCSDLTYELLGIKAAHDAEKKAKDAADNPGKGGKDAKKKKKKK